MLVGGAIYDNVKDKERCLEYVKMDDLEERLKIPQFKEEYEKACKSRKPAS